MSAAVLGGGPGEPGVVRVAHLVLQAPSCPPKTIFAGSANFSFPPGRQPRLIRRLRTLEPVSLVIPEELRAAARGTDNVLPPMKRALSLRATVGEVCDALRDVWGVYRPSEHF